ncbi:hypothetical protein HN446_04345 [bacterium]|jgi:hypothetical protein|nr:hypothetical protein [bacterium]
MKKIKLIFTLLTTLTICNNLYCPPWSTMAKYITRFASNSRPAKGALTEAKRILYEQMKAAEKEGRVPVGLTDTMYSSYKRK